MMRKTLTIINIDFHTDKILDIIKQIIKETHYLNLKLLASTSWF